MGSVCFFPPSRLKSPFSGACDGFDKVCEGRVCLGLLQPLSQLAAECHALLSWFSCTGASRPPLPPLPPMKKGFYYRRFPTNDVVSCPNACVHFFLGPLTIFYLSYVVDPAIAFFYPVCIRP